MRYITLFILYIICASSAFAINEHARDSLLRSLQSTTDPAERCSVYRNLADVCFETPDEKPFLLKMYQEAQSAGDRKNMLDALGDIIFVHTKEFQMDSAYRYMMLIQETGNHEEVADLSSYYHMRFFEALCGKGEKAEAIDKELNFLKSYEQKDGRQYKQIADAYITGQSLSSNEMKNEALPYFKTALKLAEKLPDENGEKYKQLLLWNLGYMYGWVNQFDSAKHVFEKALYSQKKYYDSYYSLKRPFYNLKARKLQLYTSLLLCELAMHSSKADDYWNKIVALSKSLDNPADRYSYFLAMNNYYLNRKPAPDYEKALQANDSLIYYASFILPANIPGLNGIQSQIYEAMGKYKEALDFLKISYQGKDSLASETMHKQLSELQVKYDINKLNNENARLELKNKQILLACLTFFLVIAIALCFYLYRNLKKEKAMKLHLHQLNEKAEESEKMKRAFVNSICHEIRTPLNAIVGFSDLIFSVEMDEEMRSTFPKEIQKNASLLTSLVNGMLEVANLDVSQEKLPCQPTDIKQICTNEMDVLRESIKPSIKCHLDIPESSVVVSTHEKYLSLVIAHLLENANKFTEQGDITLSCCMDKDKQELILIVEDSGCGIPEEMYHKVFERFSKLNEFTPGNGLGLYLCKLIITRLSGDIRIDPEYTGGTRFVVTLPV